ncbi:MAG: hypothetical protein ACR2PL_24855 [Dehalococcoidia bacterium]
MAERSLLLTLGAVFVARQAAIKVVEANNPGDSFGNGTCQQAPPNQQCWTIWQQSQTLRLQYSSVFSVMSSSGPGLLAAAAQAWTAADGSHLFCTSCSAPYGNVFV